MSSEASLGSDTGGDINAQSLLEVGVGSGVILSLIAASFLSPSVEPIWLPYVWLDLALVHLVASWWFAGLLLRQSRESGAGWLPWVLGPVCLGLAWLLTSWGTTSFAAGVAVRSLLSVGIVLLARRAATAMVQYRVRETGDGVAWVLAVLLVVVPPLLYSYQRVENALTQLRERLGQQRLATALELAERAAVVRPVVKMGDVPLRLVILQLQNQLTSIRAELETLDAGSVDPAVQAQRAVLLAISGESRTAELVALRLANEPGEALNAALLLGTLYEERSDWEASSKWYRRAERFAVQQSAPLGDQIRALNGIGFAERKLGNRATAEQAYLNALRLAPMADAHFLLAQFYEDIQRAEPAAFHVQRAMALAPDRYQKSGELLLDKLLVHHIGCFSIYRSRSGTTQE